MELRKQIKIFLAIAEPAVLVRTNEPHAAVEEIGFAADMQDAVSLIANPIEGISLRRNDLKPDLSKPQIETMKKMTEKYFGNAKEGAVIAAKSIELMQNYPNQEDENDPNSKTLFPIVTVFQNLHQYMRDSPKVTHMISEFVQLGKKKNKLLVIIAPPSFKLPPELDSLFAQIDHDLPAEAEYLRILQEMRHHHQGDADQLLVAKMGRGLTRFQFESAVASCLAAKKNLDAGFIWDKKVEIYNSEGLLEIVKPSAGLASLGGMKFDKEIVLSLIKKGRAPKILKVGPPGTGKTQSAKCLGFDCGLPVINVRLDAAFGQFVGQSEERTRSLHAQLERNAPCIAILDELPRFLSTEGSSATSNSGGVDAKVGGQWLTWLSSPKAHDIVIVGTANEARNVQTLVRAQRFDFVTYTSIESSQEKRDLIWELYKKRYELDCPTFNETYITPAEQEEICKLANWLGEDIETAKNRVTRVMETMQIQIEEMEHWGRSNCIDNETGFRFPAKGSISKMVDTKSTRRRVHNDN